MQLILLNNQGQVLADSSLKYKPLEKINLEERGETRSLGNNLMQWIPLKKGNTPIILRWQRSFYMSQVQLGEDLPWQILVKISANPYIQELEKSYIRNLTIMLFISLFGLGMSQLISRRLTAPLLELSQVTTDLPRKIAKDIPVRLNAPSHIFELNQLAENFQLMITTLQSQFSKLKQAKSTLEQRVLERTEDLLSFTENLSQEIKQRELTELSLRESEERYALAVAGTNDGIWDWNVKTNQVYYSPTWLRIVGYEDEPIETRLETWLEKIHPEDKYKCLEELQKHLEGQTAMFEHSQRLYHKQGHYIWVAIKGKCMRDSQGNPSYIAGTLTDVTLQQQAQEQLIIAKQLAELANKSKNEFIANISHEIRTPMTTILGFCDLLQDAVHDPHAQSYIKAIAASGQTLLSIINDILDLSKIEAGKLAIIYEPLDLAAVISEVSHFFTQQARQKNLDIFIHLESSVPAIIKFDEIRLRQILFNVLGNALKFTEKGWIKITAQAEHRAEEANYVQLILSITDTGIGIPVEQQEQIFEAFAQREGQNNRKYGGAGLGLTITRRLTSMLGGEVYLKSEINQGSTFSFHFPRVEVAHISNYLPTESVEKVDLNKYYPAKILIAEDNLSHQDLLREYFANSHHQLIFATDGESAFSLAISEDVDLVLMDLKMPKMGGVETLKKFKQHPELWNIPMIILTAWLRAEEREYLENICQGIILKPFSKSQLTSALKAILHPLYSCSETTLLPIFSKIYSQKSTDLIRELEVLETTIWSEICQTMIMANIRQCAYQLEGLFQTYQATELCIYTDKLLEYLNSYDIEKFTAILKEFPQIKKFLEH
jgi:PAS domain S-box-containing protein